MDETETRLASSAIRGSGAALDQIWRRHRRWIAAVVLAYKPAEADAEDILQDIAATLVQRIGELRDPEHLRAWLRALARNAAVSRGRAATVQRRRLQALEADHDPVDPAADVEARLEARESASRAVAALDALSEEERECLLLRGVHGMTQKAIAEHLGVPVTTVETRLARGRRRLRTALAAQREPRTSATLRR